MRYVQKIARGAAAFLLLALLGGAAAGETRIAVADFRNNADGVTDGARRAITDMLTTELGRVPGVAVIERSRLEAIAREHRLAASGLVEASTAVQIGQLAGVSMIITGSITEFASTKSGGVIPIGGFNIAVGENKARVTLDVRTIDTETGKVLRTFRETGEATKDIGGFVSKYGGFGEVEGGDILASATYECVKQVVVQVRRDLQMMGASGTFHVIDVRGKKKIFVDAGALNANTNPGQIFAIFAEGAPITGINGEILGVEKYHFALVKCLSSQAQYSICELVKGSAVDLRRGDLAEPYFDNPEDFRPKSRTLAELQSGTSSQGDMLSSQPQPGVPVPLSPSQNTQPLPPVQPVRQPQPIQPALPGAPELVNTSESMEVVAYYPLDEIRKNQIRNLHKAGYRYYSDKKYAKAYQSFVQAVELYPGNYLDAYWAARGAHKQGSKEKMIYWLQKALDANPSYEPALKYAQKYAPGKVEPGKNPLPSAAAPTAVPPVAFLPPQNTLPQGPPQSAPPSSLLTVPSPTPQPQDSSLENLFGDSGKDAANTSDGVDVVDTYDISDKTKAAIRSSHNMGLRFYEDRNYPRAAVAFKYAYGEYTRGNYLDAYWAAMAFHKMRKTSDAKYWVEKALSINPDYKPALKFQRMYF